jgi:hypothetical protein
MRITLELALFVIIGLGGGGALIWLDVRRPRLTSAILGLICSVSAVGTAFEGYHSLVPILFAVMATAAFSGVIRKPRGSRPEVEIP